MHYLLGRREGGGGNYNIYKNVFDTKKGNVK